VVTHTFLAPRPVPTRTAGFEPRSAAWDFFFLCQPRACGKKRDQQETNFSQQPAYLHSTCIVQSKLRGTSGDAIIPPQVAGLHPVNASFVNDNMDVGMGRHKGCLACGTLHPTAATSAGVGCSCWLVPPRTRTLF